jgi:hypothetical protein
MIANDARCTSEIISGIAMTKAAFNRKLAVLSSKLELNLKMNPVKYNSRSVALCGAEIGILQVVQLECGFVWC